MKRKVILIVMFITILTLSACSSNKSYPRGNDVNAFNNKEAIKLVDQYMEYLFHGQYKEAKELTTITAPIEDGTGASEELKTMGWKVEDLNSIGDSVLVRARVAKSSKGQCISLLEEHMVKVKKHGQLYKIEEIQVSRQEEAFKSGESLRVRQKNNVDTALLIDKGGFPHYIYPKGGKEPIREVQVPSDIEFAMNTFNYAGDKIALAMEQKGTFIAIVKIEETLGVHGDKQNNSNESDDNKDNSKNKVRETPLGKELISVDLINDGKVVLMSFSKDEKFLVVQYKTPEGIDFIRCYNAESGEVIGIDIEKQFPKDKAHVSFSNFDKNHLYIEVKAVEDNEETYKNLNGIWQIDLKDFKIKKL